MLDAILKLMEAKPAVIRKTLAFYFDLALPALAFAIPLLVSGPQLLTGSIVNCFLFLSAVYSNRKTQTAIVIGPSIAALLNGLVFGKFTPFLAYFLPFIWIGNLILIKTFKKADIVNVITSSFLKSSFLLVFAFLYFKFSLVPQIFLTAMGIFQLITAVFGGVLFLGINKYVRLRKTN